MDYLTAGLFTLLTASILGLMSPPDDGEDWAFFLLLLTIMFVGALWIVGPVEVD